MKKRLKIAIDIDGTLASYQDNLYYFLNQKYKSKFKLSDMKRDDAMDLLGKNPISRALKLKRYYSYSNSLLNLSPINGSQKAINSLAKNHDLYIVTTRFIKFKKYTLKWVMKQYPNIDFKKIIFSPILSFHSRRYKIHQYRILAPDFIIEDSAYVAQKCSKLGIPVILLNYSWNKEARGKGIIRVKNWNEALNVITKKSSK